MSAKATQLNSVGRTRSRLLHAYALSLVLCAVACGSTQRPDGGSGLLQQGNTVASLSAVDQRGAVVRVGPNAPGLSVVYFYPKDGTPGCTAEACAFRDVWKKYQAANITVIGVSNDDRDSHVDFAKAEHLPFSLVADTDGTWAKTFGVSSFAGFYSRVTFLVGSNGLVLKTYRDVDPGLHALEILNDAQAFQSQAKTRNGAATAVESVPTLDPLAPAPRHHAQQPLSVHLSLQASSPKVSANGALEFWLGATLTPPPSSHLYWKHSGEVGLPTRLEFAGPPGVQVGEVQYPGPKLFTTEHGQVGYGYDGPVTIVARATTDTPLPEAAFEVFGSWLSCDVRCVKEQGNATVMLRKGAPNGATLDIASVLTQLAKPGTDAGLKLTFESDTQLLSIHADPAHGLDVLELFPEQDLGPEDRVPVRQADGKGIATWKWRAAREPHVLTLLIGKHGQATYYRVAR